MSSEERLQLWRDRITACESSGLSIAEWCRRNKINPSAFYQWRKRLNQSRSPVTDPAGWVQVSVREEGIPASSPIVIRLGRAIIEVSPGFDRQLLRDVVQMLGQS